MSNFFKYLYTKFLLRDVLAKAVPGFLVLAYLFHNRIPVAYLKHDLPEIVVITVLYGLSFMTGMLLQFLGARFRLIRIHVHNNDVEATLINLKEFLDNPQVTDRIRQQRERFVILKEMSGTYSTAVFPIALIEFVKFLVHRLDSLLISMAILFILVFVLAWQNRFHACEQKTWEDIVSNGNIQTEDKAKKRLNLRLLGYLISISCKKVK